MSMRLAPAPKVAVITDDDRLAVVTNHRHTKNITSDPVEVLLCAESIVIPNENINSRVISLFN